LDILEENDVIGDAGATGGTAFWMRPASERSRMIIDDLVLFGFN
jgi:hypothetical protein